MIIAFCKLIVNLGKVLIIGRGLVELINGFIKSALKTQTLGKTGTVKGFV
jgi:hypothetical protein